MRGRTYMMYVIMAKGSPWVTPSLLCKKWPDPSSVPITTRLAQWRKKLMVNCMPLGHSCRTDQSIAFRFSSLKAFLASMSRNPQSSSWECCHGTHSSMPASTPPASCSVPQAALESCPVIPKTHFNMRRCHVSPTPTGLNSDCLSSEINRPLISPQ